MLPSSLTSHFFTSSDQLRQTYRYGSVGFMYHVPMYIYTCNTNGLLQFLFYLMTGKGEGKGKGKGKGKRERKLSQFYLMTGKGKGKQIQHLSVAW